MADAVCVGLDLGSDTLKIAYAYGEDASYGKLIDDKRSTGVGVPAVAYYDTVAGKWLYGDEVDMGGEKAFVRVVKIKALISLLSAKGSARAAENNARYYREGNEFPKFRFPERRKAAEDFGESVRRDMTFTAPGYTPESVCAGYFAYVRALIERDIAELAKLGRLKGGNRHTRYPSCTPRRRTRRT